MHLRHAFLVVTGLGSACGTSDDPFDGGLVDSMMPEDAVADDAGADALDDASLDAGVPDAGPLLPSGTFPWVARIDGGRQTVEAIAVDASGATYVVGQHGGTVTFGTGAGQVTSTPGEALQYAYVARFLPDGTAAWVRHVDNTHSSFTGVVVDGTDVIVAGTFIDSATFGEGEPTETTLEADEYAGVLARYDADGALEWATLFATGDISVTSMARDDDGRLFLAGQHDDAAVFGVGGAEPVVFSEPVSRDGWVAAFDESAALVWASRVAQSSTAVYYPWFIDLVPLDTGGVVAVGIVDNTVTFGPGEPNQTTIDAAGAIGTAVLARYAGDGALVWVNHGASTELSYLEAVVRGPAGDIYACGSFFEDVVFDEGLASEVTLQSAGTLSDAATDLLLLRVDESDGHLIWGRDDGAEDGGEACHDLLALPSGDLFLVGEVRDAAGLGIGLLTETTMTVAGQADMLLARYDDTGDLLAAWTAGGRAYESLSEVAAAGDRVVAAGAYDGPITFNAGTPLETTLTPTSFYSGRALLTMVP